MAELEKTGEEKSKKSSWMDVEALGTLVNIKFQDGYANTVKPA